MGRASRESFIQKAGIIRNCLCRRSYSERLIVVKFMNRTTSEVIMVMRAVKNDRLN